MFVLAFLFLMFLAGLIHRSRDFEAADWDGLEARLIVGGLLVLWPIFLIEAAVRLALHRRGWRSPGALAACLAAGLLPPLRLGTRSATQPEQMWLPGLSWQQADFDLQKKLEHFFSLPMMLMAFLILPVLVVEYAWAQALEDKPALRTVLSVGISLIWFSFTVEFIIRISAADRRGAYAFDHWIDLAVVLLPVLEFLPFLRVVRLTRVMRMESLMAWVKYYRLYGLAGKGWRGLVALQLIHRLISRSPESQLVRLLAQLEGKEKERRELDREIDYYRRKIEALRRRMDVKASG
jgi:hypothetical protein